MLYRIRRKLDEAEAAISPDRETGVMASPSQLRWAIKLMIETNRIIADEMETQQLMASRSGVQKVLD